MRAPYLCGVLAAAALAALAACTTTRQAVSALDVKFLGHNTDQFFVQYGAPVSALKMNGGGTLYTWTSVGSVQMPAVSNTTGSVTDYGTFQSTTVTSGGGSMGIECDVQIVASPSGTIERFVITRDTLGWWETSRCHEIFG